MAKKATRRTTTAAKKTPRTSHHELHAADLTGGPASIGAPAMVGHSKLHTDGLAITAADAPKKPRKPPPAEKGERIKLLLAELYPNNDWDDPYIGTSTIKKALDARDKIDSGKSELASYAHIHRALGRAPKK
jgi:hypothetical protein